MISSLIPVPLRLVHRYRAVQKKKVNTEDAIKTIGRLKAICVSLMVYRAELSSAGLIHSCVARDWNRSTVTGSLELVQASLRHGAEINELLPPEVLPHDGERRRPIDTPLLEAVIAEFPEMVKLLLDNGACPNITGDSGMTAMGVALRTGKQEMVDLLKARGVGGECGIIPTRDTWWKPLEQHPKRESAPVRRRRLPFDS
jgi:hypothetical protein